MELREHRTELERLLGDVWDYEDGGHKKTQFAEMAVRSHADGRGHLHVFAVGHCRSRHDGARARGAKSCRLITSRRRTSPKTSTTASPGASNSHGRLARVSRGSPRRAARAGRADRDRRSAASAVVTAGAIPDADADAGRRGAGAGVPSERRLSQLTSRSNLRRLSDADAGRRASPRRPRRRRSWSRSSQRRRPRRPRSRSNSRRLLWRRRRPSRRRRPGGACGHGRGGAARRPSQLRPWRTRRCPRHDRAGSRPQSSVANRRITAIRAPSIARPVNRMF